MPARPAWSGGLVIQDRRQRIHGPHPAGPAQRRHDQGKRYTGGAAVDDLHLRLLRLAAGQPMANRRLEELRRADLQHAVLPDAELPRPAAGRHERALHQRRAVEPDPLGDGDSWPWVHR